MTGGPTIGAVPAQEALAAMLRGAAVPAGVVGLVCTGVALVLGGVPAAAAALLAAVVVLAFFATSLLVLRATARRSDDAGMLLAMALLTYVTKVGVLGLMLLLLADVRWLPGGPFAATTLAVAAVWLGFEIRAFARATRPGPAGTVGQP